MASSWTISGTDGTLYTVTTDVTTTYYAVITGAVTDETFGSFNMPGFAVELTRDDLQSKNTPEGLYAVTGRPVLRRLIREPDTGHAPIVSREIPPRRLPAHAADVRRRIATSSPLLS